MLWQSVETRAEGPRAGRGLPLHQQVTKGIHLKAQNKQTLFSCYYVSLLSQFSSHSGWFHGGLWRGLGGSVNGSGRFMIYTEGLSSVSPAFGLIWFSNCVFRMNCWVCACCNLAEVAWRRQTKLWLRISLEPSVHFRFPRGVWRRPEGLWTREASFLHYSKLMVEHVNNP